MNKRSEKNQDQILCRNRKAHFDFEFSESFEAGIVLLGSEVKSLRGGHATLSDGYVIIRNNEAWLCQVKINEYSWANQFNHLPDRERKLLLHKSEIAKLRKESEIKGCTIVPTAIHLKNGKIKIAISVGRGKKSFEKRDSKLAQEAKRDIDREIAHRKNQ